MAGPYYSKQRVYRLDANGEPAFLLYAEGDEIPQDEAQRQGLVPSGKMVTTEQVENKAVRPTRKATKAEG